jgi:hypothetical protein
MRILAAMLLFPAIAAGAPFLVSDPDPNPAYLRDQCVYQDGTAAPVSTPLATYPGQSGPGCMIDLAGFAAGTHNLQVWYHTDLYKMDSAKVPFTLSVPVAGGPGPANLILKP